jgi:uncharacterized SAM-binding protein YcdF (DUF218 family)
VDTLTVKTIAALIYPPVWNYALIALGLLLLWRRQKFGMTCALLGFVPLVVLSIFNIVSPFASDLSKHTVTTDAALKASGAQAIVIMGGGRYPAAPEYGGRDTVNQETWVRVRYGARVHKITDLPILVTGGRVFGEALSEAQLMREALEQELHVPVRWVEGEAQNSADNAFKSFAMLQAQGITRIVLVTHAYHLARSVVMFERAGFSVVPAGTIHPTLGDGDYGALGWIPSTDALSLARRIMHEHLGMLWYALRY